MNGLRDWSELVIRIRQTLADYQSAAQNHEWDTARARASWLELLAHEAKIFAEMKGMDE